MARSEPAAGSRGAASKSRSRHLDWEGCLNLRDLGGLPTESGALTAYGEFVRGDTLCGLTESGRAALLGYGIRTVIDLRSMREITAEPNPFATLPDVISYVHRPLNDPATDTRLSITADAAERYIVMTDAAAVGQRIGAIFSSLAEAPDSGVLFHCFAGRDRTGVVAALLLRLAGVGIDTIVEDYEVTDTRLRARYDQLLTTLDGTPRERFLLGLQARGHPIRRVIEHVEDGHGSVSRYLEAHGARRSDLDRVRSRIRPA